MCQTLTAMTSLVPDRWMPDDLSLAGLLEQLIGIQYVYIIRRMDMSTAIDAFSALAQPTRLDAFRLLIRHHPAGLPAGEIASSLDIPHNTLSAHLSVLARAGLVSSTRQSRSIIYRVELDRVAEAIRFLISDCCAGRPEVCEPLLKELAPPCSSSSKE